MVMNRLYLRIKRRRSRIGRKKIISRSWKILKNVVLATSIIKSTHTHTINDLGEIDFEISL